MLFSQSTTKVLLESKQYFKNLASVGTSQVEG